MIANHFMEAENICCLNGPPRMNVTRTRRNSRTKKTNMSPKSIQQRIDFQSTVACVGSARVRTKWEGNAKGAGGLTRRAVSQVSGNEEPPLNSATSRLRRMFTDTKRKWRAASRRPRSPPPLLLRTAEIPFRTRLRRRKVNTARRGPRRVYRTARWS